MDSKGGPVKQTGFLFSILGGGFLILVAVYGYVLLGGLPWLPSDRLDRIGQALKAGETGIALDGRAVNKDSDLEFLLCRRIGRKQVGESVVLEFSGAGGGHSEEVELISYLDFVPFSELHLIIMALSALIAFVVFVLRRADPRARLLYWAIMTFATAEVLTGGFHCLGMNWASYIPAALYFVCYALAPTFLWHLSLAFDASRPSSRRSWIYIPAVVFIVGLESLFLTASLSKDIGIYRFYQSIFYFFRAYIVLCVLAALINFFLLYKRTRMEDLRARLKWILYGLVLGLGPFLFLYQLPQVLMLPVLISMEVSMAFSLLVPVCAGIAIIRYRLMDIELVINRSLVYAILTAIVVGVYLFLTRILHGLLDRLLLMNETTISALAAFVAALLFHPARKKLQDFVDRIFFRVAYDYRKCVSRFAETAARQINVVFLAEILIDQVRSIVPVKHLGLEIQILRDDVWQEYLSRGERRYLPELEPLFGGGDLPHARRKAVTTLDQISTAKESLLETQDVDLVIPVAFSLQRLRGFAAFGGKKSGERYGSEDIALLTALAQEFGTNLERLRLQEEVTFERAEKEKLNELNRLKTEFIATVSHELRTPMSTLHGLADVLQEDKIQDQRKRGRLLKVMSDECSRLSQFLHNILESGNIERNVKSYILTEQDLNEIVMETVSLFEFRLEMEGFTHTIELPGHPVRIKLDRDAIRQVLTNLLDNAIKYSTDRREIDIRLADGGENVLLSVEDRGIGVPPHERGKIFEGFFRGEEAVLTRPRGVGIGLKIVQHIMVAHGGRIRLEGRVPQGSSFIMEFPKA